MRKLLIRLLKIANLTMMVTVWIMKCTSQKTNVMIMEPIIVRKKMKWLQTRIVIMWWWLVGHKISNKFHHKGRTRNRLSRKMIKVPIIKQCQMVHKPFLSIWFRRTEEAVSKLKDCSTPKILKASCTRKLLKHLITESQIFLPKPTTPKFRFSKTMAAQCSNLISTLCKISQSNHSLGVISKGISAREDFKIDLKISSEIGHSKTLPLEQPKKRKWCNKWKWIREGQFKWSKEVKNCNTLVALLHSTYPTLKLLLRYSMCRKCIQQQKPRWWCPP